MMPVYNDKVNHILELLKYKTRDEVAAELNYKKWKSLDMYMRRKNFGYDSQKGQYFPRQTRVEKLSQDPKSYAPTRVVEVMKAFEDETADPQLVAKQAELKSHREMAEFMKKKGYEWNAYKNNYVKIVGEKRRRACKPGRRTAPAR